MRKNVFITILSLFCTQWLAYACTERIDISSKGLKPMLVITCILTDVPQAHEVNVQTSSAFFGDDLPSTSVTGATVLLNSVPLKMKQAGIYITDEDFYGVSGQKYTLEVIYDMDKDSVEEHYVATATMPRTYQLDSISLSPISFLQGKDFPAFIIMHYQDSIGEDYIGAKLFLDKKDPYPLYSNRIQRYSIFKFNVFSEDGAYEHVPISDRLIEPEMTWDNSQEKQLYQGDTLTIEMNNLSKEYYDYLEAAKLELGQKNPLFSTPRADIPSNFSGGAVGIFGAYTASKASLRLPDSPELPVRPK